ncbi:MAG: sigma-70 family RNA polymerase sigma factor [Candidatus Limnocylindrales bacterium]
MSSINTVAALSRPVTSRAEAATERTLVERARRGDHDAFTALVDARLAPTFRTVMAILGNESDARDVTQQVFVRAWTNLPGLKDPDRFAAWFGRILTNTCRSSMRGRRRRLVGEIPVSFLDEGGQLILGTSVGHEDRIAALDTLGRAINRLSVADRTILALHHHDDLSLAEVGEQLGIAPKTVKSRLFTARRALERALSAEEL